MTIQKLLKYFSILQTTENDARLKYVPWKMPDFVPFLTFAFTLVKKLRKSLKYNTF